MRQSGGPAGDSRPARFYVHVALLVAMVGTLVLAVPSVSQAQQSWKILVLRVDFPFEETDEATTSGRGRFDLRSLADALSDYQLPYDVPPHDRSHYEHHMTALARYYATVSEGRIALQAEIFPRVDTLAYTLPTTALRYGNGRTPQEIGNKWRELAADAVALAEADPEGPVFSEYDSYLIIHAGIGHETGQLNDVRSVYLGALDLVQYGGPIDVDAGNHQIDNLWILPESVDDRGRAGLNGLLAKFFGHQLGLPGLSNFADGLPAMGGWSLMDVGANRIGFVLHDQTQAEPSLDFVFGTVPPHPMAWTKARLGWIEPMTVQRDTTVTILATDRTPDGTDAVVRIVRVPLSPSESVWLENRQQRSRNELDLPAGVEPPFAGLELGWIEPSEAQFSDRIEAAESDSLAGREAGVWLGADEYDVFIPGSGILMWHVDDAIIGATPDGFNNDRERPGLVLKEADGYRDIGNFFFDRQDLTEGTRTDPFFAGFNVENTAGVSHLSSDTSPNSRTNTGLDSGVEIEVLSAPGDTMRVRVRFKRNAPGWPQALAGAQRLQAVGVDDGMRLIAEGIEGVVVFNAAGTAEARLPGSFLAASTETMFLSTMDGISATELDGSPRWAVTSTDETSAALLSGALSGTGQALVTVTSTGLRAHNPDDGALLFADDQPTTGLSAGDLDGDGDADLVAVGPGGLRRYEGSVATDLLVENSAWLAPATGDLDADGDTDVVLVDSQGNLRTVGQESDVSLSLGAGVSAAPSLVDIDGDGSLEVVVLSAMQIHALTGGGLRAPGFPATIPAHHEAGEFVGEAVAGDIDGDGTRDIFSAAQNGIYGFGSDGQFIPGFPLLTPATPTTAPVLTDLNGDGALNVATAAGDAVHAWRLSSLAGDYSSGVVSGWTQAGGSAAGSRTNLAEVVDGPTSPLTGSLLPENRAYCYPNPVSGAVEPATIRFFLARAADVTLSVYDAIGHEMDKIKADDLRGGAENEISWSVAEYASGLYICRLRATGDDGTKAEMMLRMAVSQ